ncbi:hypothetical protein GCM10022256_29770 [Frondihabitans peucedani]|uniref:Uncharacterized protein n=1 Tax=Frondihabitans peucedani TaxID=598626 RepID=A0ABP8E539_9MICO
MEPGGDEFQAAGAEAEDEAEGKGRSEADQRDPVHFERSAFEQEGRWKELVNRGALKCRGGYQCRLDRMGQGSEHSGAPDYSDGQGSAGKGQRI